jgi:branched-chain amino acid transport system ATP-binding protein
MLMLERVEAGYGLGPVLNGVSMNIDKGEVVTLLGRNGMGKSTTLKTIMGALRPTAGDILLDDVSIINRRPYEVAQQGIAYIPEERRIFDSLSVLENIRVAADATGCSRETVERALNFFPDMAERPRLRASNLSGGQRQMLAVARALATEPRLILMDEPTQGLAPVFVGKIRQSILALRQQGLSVLVVEQNLKVALSVADRVYILSRGQVVYEGTPQALQENEDIIARYLEVREAGPIGGNGDQYR